MGTKLTELRDGCFARALDDEPMFVLLARDTSAPTLVRTWAAQRRHDIDRGRRPASDMAQVLEAEQAADRMEAWRAKNDGAWRTGLFNVAEEANKLFGDPMTGSDAIDFSHMTNGHSIRREGDEYVCSTCSPPRRWDASEGDDHP